MPELQLWFLGLAATALPALLCCLVSVPRRDALPAREPGCL